ncbi:TPA: hypothetical protein ACH3X1_014260 [Trebouxia sp. C0004]
MSTSPSGLNQAEQPRQSHPATVQAFNVARAVLAYIDGLPATPERFNLLTIRNAVYAQEMAERESHTKPSWTFDYLLKADALASDRCLSVTEVKGL